MDTDYAVYIKNTADSDLMHLAKTRNIPIISALHEGEQRLIVHFDSIRRLAVGRGAELAQAITIDLANYAKLAHNNLLLKISKLRSHAFEWSVCDATAGTGKDAFVLSQYARRSVWLENHWLLYALLADARKRAEGSDNQALRAVCKNSMMFNLDATNYLMDAPAFDIIYLDPMFATTKRLTKKSVQLLRHITDQDTCTQQLLSTALRKARRKVIVKRHKKDPPIVYNKRPTISYYQKNRRFDVYQCVP